MITFNDLLDTLKQEDEVTIIELLNLTTEDLVEYFKDMIYDKQDLLRSYYDDQSE